MPASRVIRVSKTCAAVAVTAMVLSPTFSAAAPSYFGSLSTVVGQTKPNPVDLIGFDNPPDGTHGDGSVRAAESLAGRARATAPAAGLGFLGHSYSFGASGSYDDLVIDGPNPGAAVNFTMHVHVGASFNQQWTRIIFGVNTPVLSQAASTADFRARIAAPNLIESRLNLLTLRDSDETYQIQTSGQVVATDNFGPPSTDVSQDGVTLFRNVPIGEGGFLNLTSRTQLPVTSTGTPVGPGAGLAELDVVNLRAELLLSGTAIVGVPMQFELIAQGSSTASGGIDQSALGEIDTRDFGPRTDGPVFDLPAGFTANSPSLSIADNFVTPVPEPMALAALALTPLAVRRRGRRRC